MAAPKSKMPIRKTSAKGPISKGTVRPGVTKGFPVQTQDAYPAPSKVMSTIIPPKKRSQKK